MFQLSQTEIVQLAACKRLNKWEACNSVNKEPITLSWLPYYFFFAYNHKHSLSNQSKAWIKSEIAVERNLKTIKVNKQADLSKGQKSLDVQTWETSHGNTFRQLLWTWSSGPFGDVGRLLAWEYLGQRGISSANLKAYLGNALTADISTSCPNLQISPVCHALNILVPFVMV